ncbi:hypothetical protein IAT40_005961 [Kwoniella sp. CBS 6097]
MARLAIFLAFLVVCLALVQAKPITTTGNANAPRAADRIPSFTKTSRSERLSNAERIVRGLPLNKPKRMFDAKLGPRAPAPSG